MGRRFQLNRDGTIQYFADGGMAGALNSGDALNNVPGIGQFHQGVSNVAGTAIQGTGNVAQGIGSAFTAQNHYNADLAPVDLTNYGGVIQNAGQNALNGYNQFNNNLANQNALAQALVNQANGTGPNPALAQFNQQTQNNIAAQGALMAGQRGTGSNPGLLARQIAMNGANVQQNAVNQGAALQASQQLAAQNAAANLYGNIGNQITGQQNANTGLFTGAAGAQNAQNHGQVENYGMAQGINSQIAQNNANSINKTTGGLLNSVGGLASMFLAKGGEVPNPKVAAVAPVNRYPHNLLPSHLRHVAEIFHPQHLAEGGTIQPIQIAGGASIPQLPNGEGVDTPKMPSLPGMGGKSGGGEEMAGDFNAPAQTFASGGGKVPGKAKKKGDSYQNDTVPAKLSPGEVVLPRSVMQSADPVSEAAKFVAGIVAKHGDMGAEEDEFKTALKKAISGRKK